ncbi:MAG: methylmalonyl-CoA mutase [Nitrososphaerota archaeon]|nr:methylmalonyl-CoA mutase [Nitrososphaerota archaeon]MDG7023621.1 methylmalonyl-CoA mutase [Nitrososphaerota archaeon]
MTEAPEQKTPSGIEVKSVHSLGETPPLAERPGEYPFTRGIYPEMYRKRLWTIREYSGFGTSSETNRRLKFMLEQGQTGLSLAFDLPTQLGFDSDSPRSLGEIGRVGVAVSTLGDMREIFRGIDLGKVSTSMTINATAPMLFSMYAAVAEENGVPRAEVRGTVQNDILKEFIARNTYIFPPAPSLSLAIDLVEYSVKNYPKWHPISISGYHIREAGSTAVQELAYTFSDAIAYTNAALERGLGLGQFAPHFSFFFASNNDFIEEVAKFRAARRIWARIMRERFGAKDDESAKLKFHTQTAGETLTAQDPENNVVRVTIQALAAVLGGTQSLHTNSMDEAMSLPSEESAKLALRTQQVIANESGVTSTVDPLGGSYYVEYLTSKLERLAFEEIERVDRMGGMLKAIDSGYVKKEILNAAYDKQMAIETKRRVIVGVNAFPPSGASRRKTQVLPEKLQGERVRRLTALKAKRGSVMGDLERIKSAAQRRENLLPSISTAVGAGCTVGEISDTLRDLYGVYRPRQHF